jgi:beta-lactam-binding protein with PASTA domain
MVALLVIALLLAWGLPASADQMPDVLGMKIDIARKTLEQAGFKVGDRGAGGVFLRSAIS